MRPAASDYLPRTLRLLFLAGVVAFAPAVRGQQPEMETLAQRVAAQIAQSKRPKIKKVVVADFLVGGSGPRKGQVAELGRLWADELSKELMRAEHFRVVDRSRLRAVLAEKGFSGTVMQYEDMARWLGELAGAQGVVTGAIESSGVAYTLSVKLLKTERTEERLKAETRIPGTNALDELFAKDAEPASESGRVPDTRSSMPPYQAGKGGIGHPSCVFCPDPSYTSEARSKKFQGRVVLRVIITPEGRVSDVTLLRPAPYGLTEKAIEAVKSWRFKPATRPDGTPVPVQVIVEATFSIF